MRETSFASPLLATANSENSGAEGLYSTFTGTFPTLTTEAGGTASLSHNPSPFPAGALPGGDPILAAPIPVWVAHYPFTGNSPASFDPDPLSTASNLSSVGLGPLAYATIGVPAPALRLSAQNVPNSFSLSSYLSFTVTPNPGHVLNLNEFSFDIARVFSTGVYTVNYEVRSSVDGFAAAVLSGTVTTGSGVWGNVMTTLGPSFMNLSGVEFRVYFTDSNDSKLNSILLDNITVVGTTVLIPEPETAVAAVGLGLLGMLPWLRKHTSRRCNTSWPRVPSRRRP